MVMSLKFTEQTLEEFEQLAARYPDRRATLLPALWLAQRDFGFISHAAMITVAELVGVHPVQVQEVANFYTMYHKKKPGRYHFQVCQTLSCWLNGAEEITHLIEKKLNLKEGETTPDEIFSLQFVECLGSCHTAPVMQINDDYHENLTPSSVEKLLDQLKGGL
jgi:NADH-quinone oxidoreductase E subunit